MLKDLLHSPSAERILFFLLVNTTAYPSQIRCALDTPLTPLQRSFSQLERAGILKSSYQGKTRVYSFDATYPLYEELQTLLRKSYALLLPEKKQQYRLLYPCTFKTIKQVRSWQKTHYNYLLALWEKLKKVRTLTVTATEMTQEMESTKRARGEVAIETSSAQTLIFREQGHWFHGEPVEMAFTNSYQWTLNASMLFLRLEHLRYGDKHPVFLFDLVPSSPSCLKATDAHLCKQDTYIGHLTESNHSIDLHIRIIGPNKNTRLLYSYRE